MTTPEWPSTLQINAYTGDAAADGKPSEEGKDWVLRAGPPKLRTFLKPDKPPDPTNWRDPRVGWGLVLPHNPALSAADAAMAKDAPPAIQALVADRGTSDAPAPVYRYVPATSHRGFLRRGNADIPISMAPKGSHEGAIARYLLIYGKPDVIPWELQYQLNAVCAVGRLTLDGDALDNYVAALQSGWKDAAAAGDAAVIWSVDHGPDDITNLMRLAIAERVAAKLKNDSQLSPNLHYLSGAEPGQTTVASLVSALQSRKPSLIVTTSHGQTGPLDDVPKMREALGMLVDENHSLVRPDALLQRWQPSGAIWYAHACCSAGSDAETIFAGLVDKDSPIDRVLKGVAAVGARVAPLPEALLGAKEPLRAFIGHVEPTFDWTLRQRFTGQFQTAPIEDALYDRLYQPEPVGLAFRGYYELLGGIYAEYDQELRRFNKGENNESRMLYHLLLARDVQSMVMLGDPTAVLPSLP